MALTVTPVPSANYVSGNKKVRVFDLTFSSNYATGGEAFSASTTNVNLRKIESVQFDGIAAAADLATGNPVHYDHATGKIVFFEGSAAGTALSEKTNSEAYPTGCKVRVTVRGY